MSGRSFDDGDAPPERPNGNSSRGRAPVQGQRQTTTPSRASRQAEIDAALVRVEQLAMEANRTESAVPFYRQPDWFANLPESIRKIAMARAQETCSFFKIEVLKTSVEEILSARAKRKQPAKPTAIEQHFHLTDFGNAERLLHRYGSDLHFLTEKKNWVLWSGERWMDDETGGIYRWARETVRAIYAEAAAVEVPDDLLGDGGSGKSVRGAISKWAHTSEAAERMMKMLQHAWSMEGVPIKMADLDARPWLLNCLNGTVDLKTGRLLPHRREDLLTKLVPTRYDETAACPVFLSFIHHIMGDNEELVRYLQRVLGFALTGEAPDRVMWFFYGEGRNGKSTLLSLLLHLLAGYAKKTRNETLMEKRSGNSIPNDLADLAGARVVIGSEWGKDERLNEKRIKDLTGREKITARFLHKEYFQFEPTFKLFLYGNHRPVVRGTDDGIWDRVKLVPFAVRISKPDPDLPAKLLEELPGILAWLVEGCLEYQCHGFQHPDEVEAATAAYRKDQDLLATFFDDCCVLHQDAWATSGDLYRAYQHWCQENGEKPLAQNPFSSALMERGFTPHRTSTRGRHWPGIGILHDLSDAGTQRDADSALFS